MASIRQDVLVEAGAEELWAALRDPGKVDRLFPGVLVGAQLDGDVRVVTFANGLVARERIVDIDDESCRIVYAVVDGQPTHHNASMQVIPEGDGRSRIVWISDFLPSDLMAAIGPLVEQGAAALERAFRK